MAQSPLTTSSETAPDFAAMSAKIAQLIAQARGHEADNALEDLELRSADPAQQLLAGAVRLFFREQYTAAFEKFQQAGELLNPQSYPPLNTFYSQAFLKAQLVLPPRQRPATLLSENNLQANLTAIAEMDTELADTLRAANVPTDVLIVAYWEGLCLFSVSQGQVWSLDPAVWKQLQAIQGKREALAFRTPASYPALCYCLANTYEGLYGMTRSNYLAEDTPSYIKLFLHLRNVSKQLRSRELILFTGEQIRHKCIEHFRALRYLPPTRYIGDNDGLADLFEPAAPMFDTNITIQKANAYYASEEFRRRREDLIAGRCRPRIFVTTCRWTTFLKYSSADFFKAFEALGCEAKFFIEEDDVQTLSPAFYVNAINEYHPDAMFTVSHGRPVAPYLPKPLSYISFMQDRCGAILNLNDLTGHITRQDLFICPALDIREYLSDKNVPKDQLIDLPVPADPEMFFPLPEDHPQRQRFEADVSFIKHGQGELDMIFKEFIQTALKGLAESPVKQDVIAAFDRLMKHALTASTIMYEADLLAFIRSEIEKKYHLDALDGLRQAVTYFNISTYSAIWRGRYLRALLDAGINLALYGNRWAESKEFSSAARGPVARETDLNAVYNFSRINLHLSQSSSMHQRLTECGLAGGFMMVNDHEPGKDRGSARPYFQEDEELIFFDTPKDLVERCRYFLAHEDERRRVAHNMYARASKEQTTQAAAKQILAAWRDLLKNPVE